MNRSRATFWVLAAFALGGTVARGQEDWPHLRGPKYDAISTETSLVNSWPAAGPPVLWSRELGEGYSGFVAVGERVFTQYQTRTGMFVAALDADTGAELWRERVDWPWQAGGAYPGPYATPTWHAGRLFFATPTGVVGCLDAANGQSVWSVNVRKKFKGKGTEFGYAATPLIEGGRVILPVGGPGASVVALDPKDGATVWAAGDDEASYCPAYPITFRGRRLIVAFLHNALALHDAATGERVWKQDVSTSYDEHSAWPLYAEPHLFIASPFRIGAQLFQLDAADTAITARSVWLNTHLSNDVCSSVLVGGHVYGFDLQQSQASTHRPSRGQFKCLDFLTGKVAWETDNVGHATALAADGKLIILNDTGTLILARANPAAYEELARTKVIDGGLCWTPPTLSRGRLFVRNQNRAACVFLSDPATLAPDRPLAAPPDQGTRFDWFRLLSREPDYPHDAPRSRDVARWFGWCVVGVFGVAAAVASAVGLTARLTRRSRPGLWFRAAFALTAFVLGLVGTTVFSAWADAFVLTWPASLYVAFRVTLAVGVWAEAPPKKLWRRLAARAFLLLFLALGFGYYRLCLAVGYVMAWGFLAGLLPAAPLAVVAAHARNRRLRIVAEVVAFPVYFWASRLLPGWKDLWAG